MSYAHIPISDFTNALSSAAPVPGGGGAAALTGALGAALASMVSNLTVGKKRYAEYEEDLRHIIDEAHELEQILIAQMDEDARCFEPLSRAYGIAKDDPKRDAIMEDALQLACTAPLSIMKTAAQAILLHQELCEKGSRLVISDVGVGVLCCKTALMGASLNILINAGLMKDRAYAENLLSDTQALLDKYCKLADDIYTAVLENLK